MLKESVEMADEILIISKEQVNRLVEKLGDPSSLESGISEVRRMLDIKSTLAWRADAGS